METTMNKTNDTSNLEDRGTLADSELDAVTGGTKDKGSASWLEALARAMGKAMDAQAQSR
jgi:hypothetical protein